MKKLYKEQLKSVLNGLREVPQKNPIAFEISRAIKIVTSKVEETEEKLSELKVDYLLRDAEGAYVVKPGVLEVIKTAQEQGVALVPEWSGYVVDGDAEAEKEYIDKGLEIVKQEVEIAFPSIDVQSKQVKVNDVKEKLIDVLSDHFTVDQLIFLEDLGILTHLDD